MRLGTLVAMVAVVGAVVIVGPVRADAGETRMYLKSGWFSLHETLGGSTFVRDEGWMHGAGVARKGSPGAGLNLEGLLEVWGGNLSYDGHDLRNTVPIRSRTTYLGTREEVALGVPAAVAETLTLEPYLSVGHKFWIRTRSGEDWNSIYVKGGVEAVWKGNGWSVFAKGGALLPVYTRNHADLSDAGYGDVVTNPRSAVGAFGELGIRHSRLSVSVEYEGFRYARSHSVPMQPAGTPPGVAATASQAFQPETSVDWISLRLTYHF